MDITGKIIKAMPKRTGSTERGNWASQDFVLEFAGPFANSTSHFVFTVFGEDRLQRFGIQEGKQYAVYFDIDAHEFNGRWFNDVRAYDVRMVSEGGNIMTSPAPQQAQEAKDVF